MNSSVLAPAQCESAGSISNSDLPSLSPTEWQQKYKPQGPCCEWPRWQGGDPGERWPQAA